MKRKNLVVALLGLLIYMTACAANAPVSTTSYGEKTELPMSYTVDDMAITVEEVDPLEPPVLGEAEWVSIDAYKFQDMCDLIVRAKVSNVREIVLKYTREITRSAYSSLVDLQIEEVYYSSERENAGITSARVSYEVCSRCMLEDAVMLEEGEEYYLFLQKASRSESPLGYDLFCDYIVRLPKNEDCIIKGSMPMTNDIAVFLAQVCNDKETREILYEGADMDVALHALFGGKNK